ncbi:shikimate kinase 3, chloroplastic [Amborella trichopoda]|uniref:shikimate kinase 3, chloroplastic n=1 Tax=Amborella trichopoda TaxID=13333 RepID=UPI0005D3EB4B|nr:shikimate kinase 3, chloroplastic [Amborella trichopoda]XP_020521024.1 shikimate kinase 3, chloroplastic [Amborella trichopoda]XP_020521029.1 shikimate kinase 3, chloroplastic [Amborella trichopoda]|eukprot:XP_011621851.1 shikimate kinase 3, chloroplastic [Amborella trichopoda]
MEASNVLRRQACGPWMDFEKSRGKHVDCLQFPERWREQRGFQRSTTSGPFQLKSVSRKSRLVARDLSCSYKNFTVSSELELKNLGTAEKEALIIKKKALEVSPHLKGSCIFLVGLMGSGKTTVGKILSEALGYYFFDSDKLVEQAVGGTSVAQIFKEHSEDFFRDNESEALRELSLMHQLVVATGGGAVIRPVNWKYMKQGITVWLDVPLEALAKRIAAVGTDSRPLLHEEDGDAYTKAYLRLTALFKERGEAYANADARVSLLQIAAEKGHNDVSTLTPTAIATEALERIKSVLSLKKSNGRLS